jgi:hypothetical protein
MYNNYILTSEGRMITVSDGELYHYGVPGMKWGHRKAADERAAYKQAKKDYRTAARATKAKSYTAFGAKRLREYKDLENKRNKAELDMIDAKAKYKAAKAGNDKKAAKAEMKVYQKAMKKSGLVGSAADDASGGRSARLYDHMKATKGKEYAKTVEKKMERQLVTELVGGVAVMAGSLAVQAMMTKRY